jgi:hypothetical protein
LTGRGRSLPAEGGCSQEKQAMEGVPADVLTKIRDARKSLTGKIKKSYPVKMKEAVCI